MNKLLLVLFCASIVIMTRSIEEVKKQKIEQLFELTNNKQAFGKALEPMFMSVQITDDNAKKTAMNRYFDVLKKDFIVAYDKFFNENEIDDMLNYHRSSTGAKFATVGYELNAELQKAYSSFMQIIQELMPKPDSSIPQSDAVIHFDQISKGKNEVEVRNLFNQQLSHEGLSIVKFSAIWCGPCKSYAPEFTKAAQELKEVIVNGKKAAVKFIAVDADLAKAIAQEHNVVSIPTTIIFKSGKKIDSQAGYMNSQNLVNKIKQLAR